MIKVTIWNEARHEYKNAVVASIYPEGIHGAIAKAFPATDFMVRTATLDQPEHGLSQEVLDSTDVLYWWGHMAHSEVSDEIVERVKARVLAGMGLVVLHSGHFSKIFKTLMGTTCDLKWREAMTVNAFGLLPPDTLSPRAYQSAFCSRPKRCTASILIFQPQKN